MLTTQTLWLVLVLKCTLCPTHLVEVHGHEGVFLAGHDDDGVATDDSRGEQGHKRQEGVVVRTRDTDHPHWLMDLYCRSIQSRLLQYRVHLAGISVLNMH